MLSNNVKTYGSVKLIIKDEYTNAEYFNTVMMSKTRLTLVWMLKHKSIKRDYSYNNWLMYNNIKHVNYDINSIRCWRMREMKV